jgi:hypothetical protein
MQTACFAIFVSEFSGSYGRCTLVITAFCPFAEAPSSNSKLIRLVSLSMILFKLRLSFAEAYAHATQLCYSRVILGHSTTIERGIYIKPFFAFLLFSLSFSKYQQHFFGYIFSLTHINESLQPTQPNHEK